MTEEINYTDAHKELQEIVSEMENSEISIDELDTKIKRASELLKICKDKLFKTEKNVQDILEEIRNYSVDEGK
ncbi:exodeoxyribonuclease VII small subunit [Gillisia limnaea]|jgi:exodeoxyribonuclease VII small subunit|uniref:Exodeoxyribonuclease VII small subunit n=1 Tax=Gillisia limnaea (strain DSM 15749 / LMG 21470 / R-8282) TaxID=865937 RepID=H2BVN8_GILLR|nr:exodeoxyribonuclease VII small subunit [Gillisia limnaea]EHQ03994.1 Exodeoxyribonuclease VII small subunit [Gillisia limnaea DSM 15749]